MALVFVKSADGILRAVALESGSVVCEGLADSNDISADAARMQALLSEMTRERIIGAWKQIASSLAGTSQPPAPPLEISKKALIARFLLFFQHAQSGRGGRPGSRSASRTRQVDPECLLSTPAPVDGQEDLDIELRFFNDGRHYDINAMLTMRKGDAETMTAKLQKSPSDSLCQCAFSHGASVSAGSWTDSLHNMTLNELEQFRSSMTKEAALTPVSVLGGFLPALQRLRALHAKVEATLLFVEDMLCEDFVSTFQGSLIKLRDVVSEKIGQLKAAGVVTSVSSAPGTSSSPFRRCKSHD